MTIDSDEYKSTVGVANLYVAAVTGDSLSAYTAGTPEYFAPVAEVSAKPKTASETQYADDSPYDVFVSEGETTLEMTVTGIPAEILAKVLGKVFDATTGRIYDTDAAPPDYALGFKAQKSNGSYRFFWFLKGRFAAPEEAFKTKSDTPAPQVTKITFTAVRSTYLFDVGDTNQATKRVFGDEDTTNFSGTTWFNQVQTPSVASPSALALSSSTPADEASNIVVTADIVLVFNNPLAISAENGCVLIKDTDLVPVALVRTISSDRKTVTLNPTGSLTAAAAYDVVIGVTDIYGDTLDTVVNFTCAA